ncbi:hypothetical protein F2Q69_00012600 [Brassica cretica]|uniref:Uncharacterized protein n=1 Tax=Brassica cretica TaxID=69181 RepID=A0A8S9QMN5_BRACR|nr:hypothetical protein F2Q69_00012600 [Brassica cretica]
MFTTSLHGVKDFCPFSRSYISNQAENPFTTSASTSKHYRQGSLMAQATSRRPTPNSTRSLILRCNARIPMKKTMLFPAFKQETRKYGANCWGKIFHEETTPASSIQFPASMSRVHAPGAHRGHYNFKEPPGSKQRSPDSNLRVPTRPQRPKYNFRKKDRTPVPPKAHRGHYVPKEPPGSHTTSGSKYTRVLIRSPDQKEKPCTLVRPQGSITIIETSGFQPAISGYVRESPGSYIASGPQSRSHDLEKRP